MDDCGAGRSVQFTAIPIIDEDEEEDDASHPPPLAARTSASASGDSDASGSHAPICGYGYGSSVVQHTHHGTWPFRNGGLLAVNPSFDSDRYYYCCGRGHVTTLSRWISLLMLPIYLLITIFMFEVGTATVVLFTVLLLFSVGASTIYATITGSKLCLIPFLFLQVIFMLYTLVLFTLFTAALCGAAAFLMPAIDTDGLMSQPTAVLLMACGCVLILVFLLVTTHIVLLDYLFISELDETLQVLEQVQNNAKESADEHSPCKQVM